MKIVIPAATRILIVYPYNNISTNPSMVALMQELVRRGVEVHLMTPTAGALDIRRLDFLAGKIRSIPLHQSLWKSRFHLIDWLRAWKSGKIIDPFLKRVLGMSRYSVIFGVDPLGICVAADINRIRPRPMVYASFELLFESEVESEYERELKTRERKAAARCGLFLLQDKKRRDLFCAENNVDVERCELVPVSPADTHPQRTNYLRERLGIANTKTIVLYQGSLYDWSCRHEFEELVSYWSDNYCLVIHSRDRPGKRMREFMNAVSANGSIYFTMEPVPPSELSLLTASADIGLATYRICPDDWTTGDNLRYLGLSSGKIAYYAMCGLPVLARQLPGTSELLERYGFGLSYLRLADSASLLERITEAREAMSRSARVFYEQHLDPAKPIEKFCERLLALKPAI